jgi:hypothetical protein
MSYASRSIHSAPFQRNVIEGMRGWSRGIPSAMTRSQSGVTTLNRWYTTWKSVPVSTPARSPRYSNRRLGSSWSVRITCGTSPGRIRISVSSWRWRTGPVRRSPKVRSTSARKARSIGYTWSGTVGPMARSGQWPRRSLTSCWSFIIP